MDEKLRQATKLWTLAQPRVSAFLAMLVRDFRDRDDVLQETAVAVLESFDRFDPSRSFVGWALGIARNQALIHLRRKGRDAHSFDTETVERLATAFDELPSDEIGRLDHLRECLQTLESRARKLCEFRYGQDLKPAAIAAAAGMSANGVAKALQRIREQLRACIDRKAALAND